MKKPLLIAAAICTAGTASFISQPAKAQLNELFNIKANSAGILEFKGSGTAQFNNSIGTNNSFQVGSNTNLGVNASASSTPEYGVAGQAKLDLAGSTVLRQIIGTSGASQSTTDTATAANTVAHNTATHVAETSAAQTANSHADTVKESWNNSNSDTWAEYVTAAQADTDNFTVTEQDGVYTVAEAGTYDAASTTADTFVDEASWNEASSSVRQSAYDEKYAEQYNSDYQESYSDNLTTALSQINSTVTGNEQSGTIKGVFKTSESGGAQSTGSLADWEGNAEYAGKNYAESIFQSSWDEYLEENASREQITVETSDNYTGATAATAAGWTDGASGWNVEDQGDNDDTNDVYTWTRDVDRAALTTDILDNGGTADDASDDKYLAGNANDGSGSNQSVIGNSAFSTDSQGRYEWLTDAQGFSGAREVLTEENYYREESRAYNSAYSESYAVSAAGAARKSDSEVEVNGIGSDATIVSLASSTFDVQIAGKTVAESLIEATATANGTAGANLATSSFANQSQASTASAFMQAFGAAN